MNDRMTPGGGRRPIWPAAVIGLLVLVLSTALSGCSRSETALPRDVIGEAPTRSLSPLPSAAANEAREQVADPVRLRIPAIGVDAPVEPLEVDENGVLPPPTTNHGTGWWRDGPEPGEPGRAVIVGHVDSFQGPAVFFRLTEISPGDEILIDRRDGTTTVFAAQRTERHDKNAFPTQAVYGDTPDPQLRLITCGGEFDDMDRRYLDNVIVYAVARVSMHALTQAHLRHGLRCHPGDVCDLILRRSPIVRRGRISSKVLRIHSHQRASRPGPFPRRRLQLP